MRFAVVVLAVCGCSQMSLRAGAVFVGERPAFQATVDFGISLDATHRAVHASTEHGVEVGSRTSYVEAVNVDLVELDPDAGLTARIGARLRGVVRDDKFSSSAFEARGAFYTIPFKDKRSSSGFGVEVAGGVQSEPTIQPIFEASFVMSSKWRID
jgi:hypothetical protein